MPKTTKTPKDIFVKWNKGGFSRIQNDQTDSRLKTQQRKVKGPIQPFNVVQ